MPLTVPDLGDDVVRLRPPEMRDVDAITDACQDPDIPPFARVPSPYGRRDAVEHVMRTAARWEAGTDAGFVIADARDDALLGSIGLMRIAPTRDDAEIGYWVAKAARRR